MIERYAFDRWPQARLVDDLNIGWAASSHADGMLAGVLAGRGMTSADKVFAVMSKFRTDVEGYLMRLGFEARPTCQTAASLRTFQKLAHGGVEDDRMFILADGSVVLATDEIREDDAISMQLLAPKVFRDSPDRMKPIREFIHRNGRQQYRSQVYEFYFGVTASYPKCIALRKPWYSTPADVYNDARDYMDPSLSICDGWFLDSQRNRWTMASPGGV